MAHTMSGSNLTESEKLELAERKIVKPRQYIPPSKPLISYIAKPKHSK